MEKLEAIKVFIERIEKNDLINNLDPVEIVYSIKDIIDTKKEITESYLEILFENCCEC